MKVDVCTPPIGVHAPGGGETPHCAGFTPNALPEAQSTTSAESSQTGVSTRRNFIMKVQKNINTRPREKLKFSTPKEVFFKLCV